MLPVSQKSINRYRNAITCPTQDIQAMIMGCFEKMEKEELKPGQRYVTKRDFEDLNIEDPFDEQSIYAAADKLKFYTPAAQDYILKHFFVYACMEDYELEFIEKITKLSPEAEKRFLQHLESITVSIDMLLAGEVESTSLEENKLLVYLRMVRGYDYKPSRWHTTVDVETGEPKEVFRKEKKDLFLEYCEDYYASTSKSLGTKLLDVINKTFTYSVTDWYYLFLLQRVQMKDLGNKNHYQTYKITETHRGGECEYMTWRYLELLLQ